MSLECACSKSGSARRIHAQDQFVLVDLTTVRHDFLDSLNVDQRSDVIKANSRVLLPPLDQNLCTMYCKDVLPQHVFVPSASVGR